MEGILVLLLIFPGTFAFITCMALVDVIKKALRAHRHSPLDGPTFDVLKRKKGEQKMKEEYSFDELLELVAEYVTLLRSLRKLGFTKEAEQALGKCAFYFGALMMQKAD